MSSTAHSHSPCNLNIREVPSYYELGFMDLISFSHNRLSERKFSNGIQKLVKMIQHVAIILAPKSLNPYALLNHI